MSSLDEEVDFDYISSPSSLKDFSIKKEIDTEELEKRLESEDISFFFVCHWVQRPLSNGVNGVLYPRTKNGVLEKMFLILKALKFSNDKNWQIR